ncbi:MAG TPA: HD domain-containing protein [Bacteroidales bacterium]
MRLSGNIKRKIFNDPVYGFISINNELLFNIVEHPFYQRLRRIKQLGLTHMVYPGALHTRFNHSLGAMYLMDKAITELKAKGHPITEEESIATMAAILLHDIGHGPYSHTLEKSIVNDVSHEFISQMFMQRLNQECGGKLEKAIQIFKGKYEKGFLHELVSSQLDMDRLDYLRRDSFFTGVSEGTINYERLLYMLEVVDDELAVEAKGIYSVEKFITARRLMYWQVYLHKTVLVSEYMLVRALKRAKYLVRNGEEVFASPALSFFLKNEIGTTDFLKNEKVLDQFALLDDFDVLGAIKVWASHSDKILGYISNSIINRRLYKIDIRNDAFQENEILKIQEKVRKKYRLKVDEIDYFAFYGQTSNNAYKQGPDQINILFKDGTVKDIADAADNLNISMLSAPVTKYFLCYPKDL